MERPWYIQHWDEDPEQKYKDVQFDEDAKQFNREFLPLYRQYVGTKSLLKHIRNFINTHTITRKNDMRFQLICMWCSHIQYYRELHNIPFKPEDVFKIKIPKEILNLED